jgi:hypothetical protein
MTETKQPLVLSNLPLEVRHKIFEYVAVRTTKPKKLLRYWFEKKEATELAAKYVAANPGCLAPIIVYPNARYDPPDTDEELEDEGEDYEESDENEEEDDDSGENNDDNEDGDSENDEEDGLDEDEASDNGDEAENSGMANGVIHTSTSSAATQTLPPAPKVKPHAKWRHIPNVSLVLFPSTRIALLLTSSSVHAYYPLPASSRDFPHLQTIERRGKELVLRCFRPAHRGDRQLRAY